MFRACISSAFLLGLVVLGASVPATVACSNVCYVESIDVELVDEESGNAIESVPCSKIKVSYAQKDSGSGDLQQKIESFGGSSKCAFSTSSSSAGKFNDEVFVDKDVNFTVTTNDAGYEAQTATAQGKGCGGSIVLKVALKKK